MTHFLPKGTCFDAWTRTFCLRVRVFDTLSAEGYTFLTPSWPPPGPLLALSWPHPPLSWPPAPSGPLAPWPLGCLTPWSPRPLLASWLPAPLAPCPLGPLAPWPPAPHAPRAPLAPWALGPWPLALGTLAPWPPGPWPLFVQEKHREVFQNLGHFYRSLQPHERASAPPQGSPAPCTLSE